MPAYRSDGFEFTYLLLVITVIGLAVLAVSKLFPAYPRSEQRVGQPDSTTNIARRIREKKATIRTQMVSKAKTTLLRGALTALLLFIGNWQGGKEGMIFAFVLALVMNGGRWWFSDKLALRLAGAREVTPAEAAEVRSKRGVPTDS